jgi:hypothetical protein
VVAKHKVNGVQFVPTKVINEWQILQDWSYMICIATLTVNIIFHRSSPMNCSWINITTSS